MAMANKSQNLLHKVRGSFVYTIERLNTLTQTVLNFSPDPNRIYLQFFTNSTVSEITIYPANMDIGSSFVLGSSSERVQMIFTIDINPSLTQCGWVLETGINGADCTIITESYGG